MIYWRFFFYFSMHIFRSRSRNSMLLLALCGLLISAASLLILQSTMHGFQKNLVERSQKVNGFGLITFPADVPARPLVDVVRRLRAQGIAAYPEQRLELLLKAHGQITPVVAHGMDLATGLPDFLQPIMGRTGKTVLGQDLIYKLALERHEPLALISPAHVDELLGEIPREIQVMAETLIETRVPEIDQYHLWLRSSLLHNLIRAGSYNVIRIHAPFDEEVLRQQLAALALEFDFMAQARLIPWAEQNQTLMWALGLESGVMLLLFVGMTLLVGICIVSGLLLFFDRIRNDLVSFWILGAAHAQIIRSFYLFSLGVTLVAILAGLIIGAIVLWGLDRYSYLIMPDLFIERQIPVQMTLTNFSISLMVPLVIAALFSWIAITLFRRAEESYIDHIKSCGV